MLLWFGFGWLCLSRLGGLLVLFVLFVRWWFCFLCDCLFCCFVPLLGG